MLFTILENQKINSSINLNKLITVELFNFLNKNNFLDKISSQSLSLYLPEECLIKIKNRIDWIYILKRKDISIDFLKQNIKEIPLEYIEPKKCFSFDMMLENIKSNNFTSILIITEKILLAEKYTYEEFMELFRNIIIEMLCFGKIYLRGKFMNTKDVIKNFFSPW